MHSPADIAGFQVEKVRSCVAKKVAWKVFVLQNLGVVSETASGTRLDSWVLHYCIQEKRPQEMK
jgi:hypothetical protein